MIYNWPFFTILLMLLTPLVKAQIQDHTSTVKRYDLTKSGKLDRFETYSKGQLIKIEEDRNGDGHVDYVKDLKLLEGLEVELQDVNYNRKFERKRTVKTIGGGKLEIKIEVDHNEDGLYEVHYVEIVNATQKQVSCFEGAFFGKISDLAQDSMIATASLNQGFILTGFGHQIDEACLRNWGPDFPLLVRDSIKVGLQCLTDLHTSFGDRDMITGSLRNAFELTRLLESDQVKILCSESDYDWEGTTGHASTASGESIEGLNVSHPYISINPHYPEAGQQRASSEDLSELRKTLFHEQLHNLGYRHGHDIEYPYTCEDCCFSAGDEDAELKDAACRVCAGNYKNDVDPFYVKDFIIYSQKSYRNSRGFKAALHFLKENPASTQGLSLLALASADIFNPIGPKLGRLILDKNLSLSAEELSDTLRALEYEDVSHFKPLDKSAKSLSEAMLALYYDFDADKALAVIATHKEVIAKELYEVDQSSSAVGYSAKESKRVLKVILYDMWVNRFSTDGQSSDKAYELYDYFDDRGLMD